MLKLLLSAATIALTLQAVPAVTQEQRPPPIQTALIGLAVHTSDGQHLGRVIEALAVEGKIQALRVEIGGFLGLGSTTAFIPARAFEQSGDRIHLLMTADEVKDAVSKQGGQPEPK